MPSYKFAWLQKLLLPLIILIIIQALVSLGVFSRLEMSIYDAWFRLNGTVNPGEEIVIVAIDETSIGRIGPLAWPRSVHADLLKNLSEAKVVAFDITFASEKEAQEDQAFAQAIAEHGGVVLASKFYFEQDQDGEVYQVFEPPFRQLMEQAASLGFVNTPTDPDQVVRRITLVDVNTFEELPFPSLGLATALQAEGLDPWAVQVKPGYIEIGSKKIPVDRDNKALPNFWGPGQTFTTISYADIIENKIPPAFFRDKIVLIGATTQEEQDTYPTPFTTSNMVLQGSPPTPGVEIHASVVQSYLSDTWYREVSPVLNFLFLILVILLTWGAVANRGPFKGFIGALLTIMATVLVVYIAFHSRLWLNLAAPGMAAILTYTVVTGYDFIIAEMERRKTKDAFSRYVSRDVVEQLLSSPEDMALGGKKQVVTIMFVDIRGFTAYSENKDPVEVIKRLNAYLTVMTNLIFKYGGTLDKYLGDGLMAFFGAPVYYEDHVERAIKTAIDIQREIAQLNEEWAKLNEPPLLVAVGINTGPAVVGNVGSPERMDYTLIGEDVNLASRVEALSKLFETLILISDRSYELLPEGETKSNLYYVGSELVKGFTNPIACYSVQGLDLHFKKSEDKGYK